MAAIPIIAGAAIVASSAISAKGAEQKAQAAQDASYYNANRAGEQGAYSRWQTARNLQNQSIEAGKAMGSIRAAYGASGVSVSSGSAQAEVEGAAEIFRQQRSDIVARGDYLSQQYRNEQNAYIAGAGAQGEAGDIAAVGDVVGGVGRAFASTYGGGGGGPSNDFGGGGGGGSGIGREEQVTY